jgi:hypothetical protein
MKKYVTVLLTAEDASHLQRQVTEWLETNMTTGSDIISITHSSCTRFNAEKLYFSCLIVIHQLPKVRRHNTYDNLM